jgi:hypothetical protein
MSQLEGIRFLFFLTKIKPKIASHDRPVKAEALLATSRQLSRQRAHAEQHLKH